MMYDVLMAVSVLCIMLGHSAVRRHRPLRFKNATDHSGPKRTDKTRCMMYGVLYDVCIYIYMYIY